MRNVAEDIDSVGRSQVASSGSCYRLIAAHLLKVLFQPARFTRSWQATIVGERLDAQSFLDASPRLKSRRAASFDKAYRQALRLASAETGLPMRWFPEAPPFTLDELSSEDYQSWSALADPAAPGA